MPLLDLHFGSKEEDSLSKAAFPRFILLTKMSDQKDRCGVNMA
jgi:hypothetical protein